MDTSTYELVFIGSGPHCLTSLTRILEPDADDSIDLSQRKVTPKVQVLRYHNRQRTDAKYRQTLTEWLQSNVAVIDPSGKWLARWEQHFTGLGINHLRSSTAIHPDPLDTYCLATYASSNGRLEERQILNQIPKTQDFHGPFQTPGSSLFQDFCQDLIHRYCLQDLVIKDTVSRMFFKTSRYSGVCVSLAGVSWCFGSNAHSVLVTSPACCTTASLTSPALMSSMSSMSSALFR